MPINIVELLVKNNIDLNIIKNTEIIILKVEIVQILHHKFYLKVEDLEKILLGIMMVVVQLEHG
jgi:hypothetical protein